MMRELARGVLACAVLLAAFDASAQAPAWPANTIRLIAPYAAGGAVDIVSRLIAQRMSESIGRPVIVENRPGAGSMVGSELLARSAPDGYTLMMANIALSANPALHKRKLAYDPVKDFAPVIQIVDLATVLIVNPAVPAKTVAELIALAKAQPGKLNYASAGFGSVNHLAAELFNHEAGIDVVHVPYQGGGPSIAALVAGDVQIEFITLPPSLPFIKDGRVRALGVSSAKRQPVLPDVPTIAEAAIPGFTLTEWYGILAPAGTPREIVAKLNAEINRVLAIPEVRDKLTGMGAEVVGGDPEHFARRIEGDLKRWNATIKPEMRVD